MGLLDSLTLEARHVSCKVRTILAMLDGEDSKKLSEAVDNKEWPVNALAKSLTSLGISISAAPITAHRQKGCSCYRT